MNQGLIGRQQVNEREEYDIRETGITMGQNIFYTDIHWYKFFIRNCYNTKECVVQSIYLSCKVDPGFLYKLYFTLLGNWGMWNKANAGCFLNIGLRIFFLLMFVGEAFMFVYPEEKETETTYSISWEYMEADMRIGHVVFAGVYLLLSVPCLILRRKAAAEVKKNDSRLSYNRQFSRMILVNRCGDPDKVNEFYEVSISKYYEILTSVGCQVENARMFAASLTQVQTGKDVVKFMIYKPVYREICDEAHFSLTSYFSFLNWQFYLMPLYQAGIIGFWLYCYQQYGWDTKELPTK